MKKYYFPEERIAIVGVGGLFPDADDIEQFWLNLLEKKVSIKELPETVLNSKVYYRPEAFKKIDKGDKTYTRMGSMVNYEKVAALEKKFKIPPAMAEHMDQNQHAAIYCVDQALQSLRGKQPELEKTAVILGNGNPGPRYERAIERVFYALVAEQIRNNPDLLKKLDQTAIEKLIDEISGEVLKQSLHITEDSAPGMLLNLVAGRVANVFGFQGPSFTVDAACASSLNAVISGVQGLLRHEYDAVITGGIDLGLQTMYFAVFSAINALSPEGSFPFDSRANGFIIGQGGGVLIMKRLTDALQDQDNIIALVSGYGQGSDGKGKAIAAPNEDGQARVIQRACNMAGYSVDTIELLEAHGTGTTVGDLAEVNGLKKAFAALGATGKNYCGIGSVKSNVGHLKAAAGAAGLIKTALALYHKTLPPTANVRQINPKLQLADSPFYILTEKKDWLAHDDFPRRANVSAFGFGGADYHIALEEFRPEFYRKIYPVPVSVETYAVIPGEKERAEAVLFSGNTLEDISALYHDFMKENTDHQDFSLAVFRHNAKISACQTLRLAICTASYEDLAEKWGCFNQYLKKDSPEELASLALQGIYYGQKPAVTSEQIAFLFPGQASQYPNMGLELRQHFPMLQSFYKQVDTIWEAEHGYSISSLVFGSDELALERELRNSKNTHPAMFLCCAGLFKLLSESGVKADYFIGHSLGEMIALYAGGMVDLRSALHLIGTRGFSFDTIPVDRRGKMLSIKAELSVVEKILNELGIDLHIANINSPEQIVVGGSDPAISKLDEYLTVKKINHTVLNVSHAFHTALISDAAEVFYHQIENLQFSASRVKIFANHLQELYPMARKDLDSMPQILKDQIVSPVQFCNSIEKLYQKGVRVFVEVGPSTVLTNLVRRILEDKDAKVIATNQKKQDAVDTYYRSMAELFSLGVGIQMVPSGSLFATSYGPPVSKETTFKNEFQDQPMPGISPSSQESLVYSGVSFGLPGTFKKVFDENNFDLLCRGGNFIEMLTDNELTAMIDLNIKRLVKKEEASTFKRLSSINDVIRLAGKLGELDMPGDYLIDDQTLGQMTTTICAGVAAGYEALKDAGIPLVPVEQGNSFKGSLLPERYLLPKEMRDDTGIIFASCFVMVEPFIKEVSKYVAGKFGSKTKLNLIEFYETLISQIKDPETKKLLMDWYSLYYSRLNENLGEEGIYEFNNDFMTQFSSLANNRLAQFIGASGPNFQVNAACSSTANALTIAESLIRTGQAERMIVIGAENPTSKLTMPWIGGGFMTSGAATNEVNIYKAAIPFDNRRNGMIIGAGAVGILIEKEAEVESRGMRGICRLLGTHSFNMAGHQTRIDSQKFSLELERFISKMEGKYGIDRKSLAPKMVYFSHETYTPKKGGCSQTEQKALKATFGEEFRQILVTNTKGMTGHTIGASIEEAVAAKSLQYQKVPPVVNYKEPDPELEGLKLSKGGAYSFEYALRMVAGFGGQGNYMLMQKVADGKDRISDKLKYQNWLERISNQKNVALGLKGCILVAETKTEKLQPTAVESKTKASAGTLGNPSSEGMGEGVLNEVLNIISAVTKYPVEMLDLDMEMEGDLGIDTVKQATIISYVAEKYRLDMGEGLRVSTIPTIKNVVEWVQELRGRSTSVSSQNDEIAGDKPNHEGNDATLFSVKTADKSGNSRVEQTFSEKKSSTEEHVLTIISQVTKYPIEMLDLDMEMEADLGIDTVKQATIFSLLGELFEESTDQRVNISEFRTIRSLVDFVKKRAIQDEVLDGQVTTDTEASMEPDPETRTWQGKVEIPDGLCYQVPVAVEAKRPAKDFSIKGKKVWIIGNHQETVQKMASYFTKIAKNVSVFVFSDPMFPEQFAARFETLSAEGADVVIDCGDLGYEIKFEALSSETEKHLLDLNSEARFVFFKKLNAKFGQMKARIVCTVSLGGLSNCIGDSSQIIDAYSGALSGFYKGLRKEWNQSKVKVIDFNISTPDGLNEETVSQIIKEVEAGGDDFEVILSGKTRKIIKLEDLDQDDFKRVEFPAEPHFLITGGGNGITAEIALGLAQHLKGKFTLIGRTALPENISELAAMDENTLNRRRTEIHNELKRTKGKVTPLMVQAELEKLIKAGSVYRLMEKIKKLGSQVLYFSCDVRSAENLQSVIDLAVRKNGPIYGLIHGAGIEKSHMLPDKSLTEFQGVFSVKAFGICNLLRHLDPKHLNILIGFSSISGRYGNEAQLDYCAANNFLSSYIRMLKARYPQLRAVSIDWAGWKDIGMAWRNDFVKNHAEEMGLNLIEPARGVQALVKVLTHEFTHQEVVIHKGLKGFINHNALLVDVSKTPMIDWITRKSGKIERAYKVLSVKRDAIFDHHRLGTTPLIPAVAMMEMGAEYYNLQFGQCDGYCFRNLSILNPIKLFHDKSQEVFMESRPGESGGLNLSLNSYITPKIGDPKIISYCNMFVNDQPGDWEPMLEWAEVDQEKLTEMLYREVHSNPKWQFNNDISLGPLFIDEYGFSNNKISFDNNVLVYSYHLSKEQLNNKKYPLNNLLVNPCALDTLFQAAAIHCITQHDRIHLPLSAEEIGVIRVPREPAGQFENLKVIARLSRYDKECGLYNVVMVNSQGEICYYAKNIMLHQIHL